MTQKSIWVSFWGLGGRGSDSVANRMGGMRESEYAAGTTDMYAGEI